MRKAARNCRSVMALLSISAKLIEPVAGRRHLASAHGLAEWAGGTPSMVVAAASRRQPARQPQRAAQPQPPQPLQQRQDQLEVPHKQHNSQAPLAAQFPRAPPYQPRQMQPKQHPHHHAEFESIRQRWNVPRSNLHHYPEQLQQTIRSGRGGANGAAQSRSPASGAASAAAAASSPTQQQQVGGRPSGHSEPLSQWERLAADLTKLGAVLEFERQKGFINVVGSVEKLPMADWAARQLLSAAGQLHDPEAAHGCVAAAQKLRRYAAIRPDQRPAAVAAAEVAARTALLSLQAGGRELGAEHSHQQPTAASRPQEGKQQQQPARPTGSSRGEVVQGRPQEAKHALQLPSPPSSVNSAAAQVAAPHAEQPAPAVAAVPAATAPSVAAALTPPAAAGSGGVAEAAPDAAPTSLPPAAEAAYVVPSELIPTAAPASTATAEASPATAAAEAPPSPATSPAPPVGDELDVAAAEAHAEESGQQPPTPEGEEYVMSGKRRIKASTAAFKRSFAEAAAALEAATAAGGGYSSGVAAAAGGEQRSAKWFQLRERRLTASAFSKALGLFNSDRQQLWEEKVGLVQPFAGNAATAWGTSAEPLALEAYQAATGHHVESCMFQVKHDDPVHGWLGASPDGLIESLSLEPPPDGASPPAEPTLAQQPQVAAVGAGNATAGNATGGMPQQAWATMARGSGPLVGPGRGILEIKCPHNKGQPEQAVPPQHATWYYMPQIQGLMYIFDCEWCNLYIWTPQRGSAVYHIRRDRAYWGWLWDILADFWWSHVVPARQEFQAGRWEEVEQYRPQPTTDTTEDMRQWSKRMAVAAPVTFFKPQ